MWFSAGIQASHHSDFIMACEGPFSRKSLDLLSSMALVSVQISSGAVVHLPWNIVREYNSSCKYNTNFFNADFFIIFFL